MRYSEILYIPESWHNRRILGSVGLKKALIYHTNGEFPVKLYFFSQDEVYEAIYIESGQEALMNHVFDSIPLDASRLIILESRQQSSLIKIDGVTAYCMVSSDGAVSYYQKR